jgi:hypothetical protein
MRTERRLSSRRTETPGWPKSREQTRDSLGCLDQTYCENAPSARAANFVGEAIAQKTVSFRATPNMTIVQPINRLEGAYA